MAAIEIYAELIGALFSGQEYVFLYLLGLTLAVALFTRTRAYKRWKRQQDAYDSVDGQGWHP